MGTGSTFAEGMLRELTVNCETYDKPKIVQNDIRNKIRIEQEKYKQRYDKNRLTNVKFKIGDTVFMSRNAT